MRIFEENSELYGFDLIDIKSATYQGNFFILISFSNGKSRIVDFKPFLTKSLHPSINKYLDEKLFQTFMIVDGNLNWHDYDMIFPVSDLYQGKIR